MSLIHYAAMGGCLELLRHLLRTGSAKDERDQNKRTPLSWAAEYGALDSVKILLEHGAKINSTDDMDSTPLSWLIHADPHTDQAKAIEVYLRKKAPLDLAGDRNVLIDFACKFRGRALYETILAPCR